MTGTTRHEGRERQLDLVPDAGPWKGALYRLGVKKEAALWGGRYLISDPRIDAMTAWHVRNGKYELPEARLCLRHFDFGLPLVELGGGLGVLASLLNGHLRRPEAHAVVEMDPVAAALVEANRRLNGARFQLVQAAIQYGAAPVSMSRSEDRFDSGNRVVPGDGLPLSSTTTLSAVAATFGREPFNLLMDIEGMEAAVIQHEGPLLAARVRFLVVEFHPRILTSPVCAEAIDRLLRAGFRLADWIGDTMAFSNDRLAAAARP